ncbi:MAG: hypothetical protein SGJ27_15020 [Candidatus Melainabacteria bacterium]|nr:hypothetical protein [Candidatus Melainabacteria bacterium]
MMSARTSRSMLFIALAAVCSMQMGCGSGTAGDPVVGTKQGTVNVEGLKVGVPEGIIKDAVLTFVLDEQPAAKSGGRNQYLSRTKDSKGGQFSAQCKDGECFRLEAIYETPISKEKALETLTKMLPTAAGAPELRAAGEGNATAGVEKYDCGETIVGELFLVEPKSDLVRLVAATDKSKMKKKKADDEAKADDAKDADAKDKEADAPKAEGKSE